MVVVTPVVFFGLLFTIAIVYRRYIFRKRKREYLARVLDVEGMDTRDATSLKFRHVPCEECKNGQHGDSTTHSLASSHESSASSLVTQNSSQPLVSRGEQGRKDSLAQQSHFAQKSISVRRISINPAQPDVIQRVNSISSTLLAEDDPQSDSLPYGGRKSSIGGFMAYDEIVSEGGQVAIGERRPSVLNDPEGGVVDVRRVSVGGGEDMVRVRSASQSVMARQRSLPQFDFSASQSWTASGDDVETLPSPVIPPQHPFSPATIRRNSESCSPAPLFIQVTPPAESTGDLSPKTPNAKSRSRPDSLILHSANTQVILESAGKGAFTAASITALKSPLSEVENSAQGALFDSWNGFPAKSVIDPPTSLSPAQSPITSLSAVSGEKTTPSVVVDKALPAPIAEPGMLPSIQVVLDSSPRIASEKTASDAIPRLSVALSPSPSPLASPSPSPSSKGKITYLADVVKEEERRRSTLSTSSSKIAQA